MAKQKNNRRTGGIPKAIALGLAFVIVAVISGIAGGAATRHFGTSDYTIAYADFISVLLSAISVLLTVLGLILAVLAFVGWQSITGTVENRTKAFLDEGFEDGNPLHDLVISKATEIMFRGIQDIDASNYADDANGEVESSAEQSR